MVKMVDCLQCRRPRFDPRLGRYRRKQWQPTQLTYTCTHIYTHIYSLCIYVLMVLLLWVKYFKQIFIYIYTHIWINIIWIKEYMYVNLLWLFDPTQLWGQFSKHLMLEQWWVLVHDTHGYLGSHCNMVAYSQFSLMPRNKPKAFFQKWEWFYEEDGLALLRNPENMSYDSTTEATQGPMQHPYLPPTPQLSL